MWDRRKAYTFIVLMGVVSLFADMTYESARSITGPYLALLGASAFIVGAVSGVAEFLGYALKLFFGYLSDRFRSYWLFTLTGYTLTLLSVPALALAGSWQIASLLIVLERVGKAIRTPSRDVLLSYATERVGHGRGFGLHEFFDQIGAVVGPLLIALILYTLGNYRTAFAFLFLPSVISILLLLYAKKTYQGDTGATVKAEHTKGRLPPYFFVYLMGTALLGLSFIPFPLIAFHQKVLGFESFTIPLSYALAMLVDSLSALLFGYLFDKKGIMVLPLGVLITVPYVVLFLEKGWVLLGVTLWGISLGLQESIMRSWVAKKVPLQLRGKAYGMLHFTLGISSLLGATFMGYLYTLNTVYLVLYSLALQLLSAFLFFIANRRHSA